MRKTIASTVHTRRIVYAALAAGAALLFASPAAANDCGYENPYCETTTTIEEQPPSTTTTPSTTSTTPKLLSWPPKVGTDDKRMSTQLGYAHRRASQRWFGDLMLVTVGDGHGHVRRWQVQRRNAFSPNTQRDPIAALPRRVLTRVMSVSHSHQETPTSNEKWVDNSNAMWLDNGMSNTAATLATTERGITRSIWHRGAFRRVTAADGMTVRMGRYALHSTALTVEGAP